MSRTGQWLWLLLILLVALGLRLWQLDRLPPGFHFDESFEGLEAWRILTDASYRPIFLMGNFGVPPLNAYANALTFALFRFWGADVGPTAMRFTAALFGVLGVGVLYGLATELRRLELPAAKLSPAFPLFAAATLAIMRWHIHFSRMGIEPIIVPLLWAGATGLLLHGWRTGRWLSFVGCGALLAACMYTYQGAWVIPFLTGAVALGLIIAEIRIGGIRNWGLGASSRQSPIPNPTSPTLFAQRRKGLWLTAGVAFALFAPLGWFFWQHADLLLLRPAQIAVTGASGAAAGPTPWDNVWATTQMYNAWGQGGDHDPRRNLPGAPALNGWLALPFYLGLLLALWRRLRLTYLIMLSGLIGLLLPGVFSEYAPHFHRILGAAAPTALLCAVGLDGLWGAAKVGWPLSRSAARSSPLWSTAARTLAVSLLLLGAYVSTYDYFVRWAALPDLFYAFDVGLWQMGKSLAALPAEHPVYLTPRTADHPTLAFALQTSRQPRRMPIAFDGRHIFPLTAATTAQPELYAVVEHEDFRTRLLLPEVFPDAVVQTSIADDQGQLYARFYQRPAGSRPQRAPQVTQTVTLGDGIELQGYDVQPASLRPGEVLYLQLYWQVTAMPTVDWTVFSHVVAVEADGKRQVVAGFDSQPGQGSLVTTRWQTGWRILDEYQIPLPASLAPGEYELAIGLYTVSGAQLPAGGAGVLLGKVVIE